MDLRRNLAFVIFSIWCIGFLVFMGIGLGVRFGWYGWRKHSLYPGEEMLLFTGKTDGLFCESVHLESTGYITGQNVFVRDWRSVDKVEGTVHHFDINLDNKYFDFKRFRLYPGELLMVRVCSEPGTTLYAALSQDAFLRLRTDLERGSPCPIQPSENDPLCGKLIKVKEIPPAGRCSWVEPGENFDDALVFKGWREVMLTDTVARDVFIALSNKEISLRNERKHLLEIIHFKKTGFDNSADLMEECIQQQMCLFHLDFAVNQAVFVHMGTVDQELSGQVDIWSYCEAREWFFILLFGIIPIVLMAVISFFVARRAIWQTTPVVYL